jgi:sigma-B regulation protein RsbU (phosphoserine phosphatase)
MVYGPGGLRRLKTSSVPVGFFEDAQYMDVQEQLQPGDVVVIYSDGVTEALDVHGEEFGEDRLQAVLEKQHAAEVADILAGIVAAVQAFARGAAQHDDVTALVVKYVG